MKGTQPKVTTFKPRHEYRLIRDYNYHCCSTNRTIELKKGDIAVFDGRSLYARFYVKDRNDPEGRWWLMLLNRKEAFSLLTEDIAHNA